MVRSHAAKGTLVPKRRKRRSPSPMQFTAELLADGRRRYEQTGESLASIALAFGIHRTTFTELARRAGWVRHVSLPHGLPAAARLLAEAERLETEALALSCSVIPDPPPPPASRAGGGEQTPPPDDGENQSIAATVARLHREVREEIAAVEAMRIRMKTMPRDPQDAAATARTLASLTDTLQKLQRMACGLAPSGSDHDDFPSDIDEFRNELARRIDAFVASRLDATDAGRADADAPAAEAGR